MDTLSLPPYQAVELENSFSRPVTKYLVIVTTNGYLDTEETIVLGTEQEGSTWVHWCIGGNLPVLMSVCGVSNEASFIVYIVYMWCTGMCFAHELPSSYF